jgi:hypothetical protein
MSEVVSLNNYRDSVLKLQDYLLSKEHLNVDDFTAHYFADGVYMRQLTIPKGNVCVGKTHRYEHLNILLSGTIDVATNEGVVQMTGPCIVKSPAGVKRAGYAVTDTTWLTVHANHDNEQDIDKLEMRYIVPDLPAVTDGVKMLPGGEA